MCDEKVPECRKKVPTCDEEATVCGCEVPVCGEEVPGCGEKVPGCGHGIPVCEEEASCTFTAAPWLCVSGRDVPCLEIALLCVVKDFVMLHLFVSPPISQEMLFSGTTADSVLAEGCGLVWLRSRCVTLGVTSLLPSLVSPPPSLSPSPSGLWRDRASCPLSPSFCLSGWTLSTERGKVRGPSITLLAVSRAVLGPGGHCENTLLVINTGTAKGCNHNSLS